MDFLFFDDVRKNPHLVPSLIIVSTIACFFLNVLGLTRGITEVLPHLFYIPLILTAYYYPRRGVLFAILLSFCYCAASFVIVPLTTTELVSVIARSCAFIIIAAVVSFLSGRMHHDTQMCHRLVSVVNSSGDSIIGVTFEGKVTDWNAGAEQLYGFTAQEMVGNSIFRLIPLERHEEKHELLGKVKNGEIVRRTETERITKDGKRIHVSLSVSPILDSAGAIVGVSEIAHDITDRYRFQNEILMEKERWELTFNAVQDMIAIIDDHFRIVQVNKAMAERLGVSVEDAVGLTCYEAVHRTKFPPSFCPHRLLLKDKKSHSADIHEDNLHGDFSLTVSPIQDNSGAVLGSVHVLRDITEKKQAEDALRESEKKFREIFNSANDAIHLHEIDERGLPGKFIDVNDVACRMLQQSKEELLEESPLDLTTAYHSLPLSQIGDELMTKGSTIFETEYRRKDGSIVPVEVNAHVVSIQGRRMVLSIVRDLTRRKQDEAALRESEEKYRTLFDNMMEGLAYCHMIFDNDGYPEDFIYLNVNQAFDRIIGTKTITMKRVTQVFPRIKEDFPELFEIYGRVALTGTSEAFEIYFKPITKWLHISVYSPAKEYFVAVFEDITERKRAEDALELASRKLNLLSGITRHDIRNQLTALNAFIQLSINSVDNPAELNGFFAKEQKIADAIDRQISFTKDYENLGVKSAAWYDVSTLFGAAGNSLPTGNIGLEILVSGLEVFADPLFEKVFYNLIDNSLRYGGDKMTFIRISREETDTDLRIIYKDDGNGISTEDKTKLFTKGFGHHTGLGLFLSREILGITGITITENGEPGKGARFEIIVPRGAYRFS